ncbi:MAG: ribonuclease HII [Bacilli bacterium]|nr:ribonuclease HII [Bacilli bacterium]MBN2876644.1 ribonuclease HII [Bacilli bacterium]
MYQFEENAWNRGYHWIAGVDEVGRGPLAGPVVAAAVILDPKQTIEGLNDSKQLTAKQRQRLLLEIKDKAIAFAVSFISETVIDEINIYQASKLAMLKAIEKLSTPPDYILSDAMPLQECGIPFEAIIKGDTLSASIAAASILAKETRDEFMVERSTIYPGYDFEHNMGYPTKKHLDAIQKIGICEIHRKSYKPVKDVLQHQMNLWEEEDV